ncbi:MAG: hypothetical protein AB8B95_13730 [Pseudohongiellaceae bacterium]
MTLDEFKTLLDTFGGTLNTWPSNSRKAGESLLESNPEARLLIAETEELDNLLSNLTGPDFTGLEQRVLSQQLPSRNTWIDSAIQWLVPNGFGIQLWRPVAAGILPLVFGIAVGNFFSFGISDPELALGYWDDELALLSFSDLSVASDTAEF